MAVARSAARTLVLLASIAAAEAPAQGQSQRAYRDGVKAAEKGDWQSVKELMTVAIADRAEERKRYTPHYYLGLALFELGDCDGALGSWQTSQQQGALGKEELAKVRSGLGVCAARQSEQAAAAARLGAQEALDRAGRSAAALRSAVDSGIDQEWRAGSPSGSSRQAAAEARLESAKAAVEQAGANGDAAGLARAESEARQIEQELDALQQQALRLRSEQGARAGALRTKANGLVASARELLRSTAELAPYPPQVKRKRADLESLLADFDSKRDDRGDAYLEGLISRITFSMQQLTDVTAAPPPALAKAAESFFAGDYPGVVDQLATFNDATPRGRAHALLLRSAARYYLWVDGGQSDQDLLAAAASDAAACHRENADLRPPSTLFSPHFVEFWSGTRESSESP